MNAIKENSQYSFEIKNNIMVRDLKPWYSEISRRFDYADQNKYVFDYANNEPCGCSTSRNDSIFVDPDFKSIISIETNITGKSRFDHCNENMEDFECYYQTHRYDPLDLSIQNSAQNGCMTCYSIGPNLWPVSKDNLLNLLIESEENKEDCTPKKGYHKSHRKEIFRCKPGSDLNGVISFTEAGGDTDYQCGFEKWGPSSLVGGGLSWDRPPTHMPAIFLVRLFVHNLLSLLV